MADVKMIATRESYGNTLKALAAEGHDDLVVLDADLAAATKTGMFRKAHPDRHFDCGIAEANMMGVAAGLSTMGYVPFVSSFAMFAAGRAFEQIRNSVAYPCLLYTSLGRGERPPEKERVGPIRRPAAAPVHRPGSGCQARSPADG